MKIEGVKKSQHNLSAVLFDYDGVLVKTSAQNYLSWKNVFASEFGVHISDEEYYLLEGMSAAEIAFRLISIHGILNANISNIVNKKENYFKKNYIAPVYIGVFETLNYLKNEGLLSALVSGSSETRICDSTPKKLLSLIDVKIHADNTFKNKPNPDPYLTAIKMLNVKAEDVIVVENSPLGIQSAKAAHLFCIALCTTLEKKYLMKADLIFRDFMTFSKHITKLI